MQRLEADIGLRQERMILRKGLPVPHDDFLKFIYSFAPGEWKLFLFPSDRGSDITIELIYQVALLK